MASQGAGIDGRDTKGGVAESRKHQSPRNPTAVIRSRRVSRFPVATGTWASVTEAAPRVSLLDKESLGLGSVQYPKGVFVSGRGDPTKWFPATPGPTSLALPARTIWTHHFCVNCTIHESVGSPGSFVTAANHCRVLTLGRIELITVFCVIGGVVNLMVRVNRVLDYVNFWCSFPLADVTKTVRKGYYAASKFGIGFEI